MSLQAEVPYDDSQSESDTETEGWRDPLIISEVAAPHPDLDDIDFSFQNQDQQPDDCWILPPEFPLNKILGEGQMKLNEIRHETSASLKYNESKHQVDIWGDRNSVQHAKRLLDLLASHLHEISDATRRRTKKWEKPERELTAREKKRMERQQARKTEEKLYQGLPDVPQPFNALVPFPEELTHPVKIFGFKDAFLNRLRAECKCWMNYDSGMNAMRITGEEEARVAAAASRMRNWYLRCVRSPYVADLRVLKQPKKNMIVQLNKLPSRFLTHKYFSPPVPTKEIGNYRVLEGLVSGRYDGASLPKVNLIDLEDISEPSTAQEKDPNTELPASVANLDKENVKRIEEALQLGLESIRLSNLEIRMKIRFGQVCMIACPPETKQISVENLTNIWFPHPKTKTALAPCVGRTMDDMKPLFEYLSHHCTQFHDSPRTTYTIDAVQTSAFAPRPEPGRRMQREQQPIGGDIYFNTVTICKFTSEGRVGLWNTLTDLKDQVTVSCADLEKEYSWELKLQHARRMGTELKDTPHGKFIENLKLNPTTQRLILLPKSEGYNPTIVTQRTKWVYEFENKWIIEVGRDEIWDIPLIMGLDKSDETSGDRRERVSKSSIALPIDLSTKQPERVIFKVSMYCEDWVDRFAGNLCLSIGEAPDWTICDFLASDTENVDKIMEMAQKITSILANEVPQYWTTLM
ncbi:hypothetical protein BX666DRAFT_1630614 [Dichotomocladium elegans]|nr:hypothetical protein BX666DRAFT_1630614 [Dichotomocladium elegans]